MSTHDLWINGYFEEELSIPVYHKPKEFTFNNTSFFSGQGDGLGPEDKGYKRLKKVFTSLFFKWGHQDIGMRIAQYFFVKNKQISDDDDATFLGEENEWLAANRRKKLEDKHRDFFVFGHRHLPLEIQLNDALKYINLCDWIQYYTYGVFDGETFDLKAFK